MENALPKEVVAQNAEAEKTIVHLIPDTNGKSAAEYTFDAMKLHEEQYKDKGTPPPALVKWMGDASLAVLPKNRFFSAVGLTAGLVAGGKLGNVVTGYTITGKKVENIPKYLKWLNVVKNYDPHDMGERNRFIKYGQAAAYLFGGALGIKAATDFVYKDTGKNDKDAHYLEEYLTNVSHTQGKTWGWLSALSGMWGSASGTWMLPIPGLNYATGIIGRVTSMQDRNTMISGMNKFTSGATTSSYLRLREGMHYLAHYAVNNPAQDPTQIEYLAFTLLGPLFKDKLTAEHIKQFTAAVHEVRDHYWQEGGIPKAKRTEAIHTMKEIFTGAGLEVLLIDMGLNPATVAFDEVNGFIGKIGDIGHKQEIRAMQNKYWKELEERLPKYVEAGIVSKERAEWIASGIADMRNGKNPNTPPPPLEHLSPIPEQTVAVPTQEQSTKFSEKSDIRPKQTAIDNLIKTAEGKDDWRTKILGETVSTDTPRFVLE